jgi:Trypsin
MVGTNGRSGGGRGSRARGQWHCACVLCLLTMTLFYVTFVPRSMAQANAWHNWSARAARSSLLRGLRSRDNRGNNAHVAIVGGREVEIESAPWQVAVVGEFEGLLEICGGSILDTTHILTAGHCAYGPDGALLSPSALFVDAGTSNALHPGPTKELRPVSGVRVHPDFQYAAGPGTPDDVAVLALSSPLSADSAVQSISLAQSGSTQPEGASVNLTGYGLESPTELSGRLNSLTLDVRYSRECGGEADALFVCASAAGGTACFSDEGGPLTSTQSPSVLVGVMDTIEPVLGNPCSAGALDGFVNVAAPEIRDFIEGSESPPQAPRGGHAVIKGFLRAGTALTCLPGTWSNSPTFTYVFENNADRAVLQAGASPTYQLSSANVGQSILCEVQASNAGGTGIGRTPGIGPILEEGKPTSSGSSSSSSSSSPATSTPTPTGTQEVAGFQAIVPPPLPDAQLAGTALEASLSGIISVKVSCPAGATSCTGTITLRTLNAVSASSARAAKSKGSILTLASGSFTVAGGKVATVKLHLSAKARALLARSRVLRARASIVAHDPAGASHTAQTLVTLRAAKPKHG